MMIVIFLSLLVLVAIIFLYVPYGFMNESILVEDAANINSSRRIVRRDGVILFTDAGRGDARDAAIELVSYGYHVLAGVQSEAEKKSFLYDSRKGLEVIQFDFSDPATLASLVYRLRQIERELDRKLTGVVINLADYILDHPLNHELVDIGRLDANYKALLKGPVRLLQTIFELFRHQNSLPPPPWKSNLTATMAIAAPRNHSRQNSTDEDMAACSTKQQGQQGQGQGLGQGQCSLGKPPFLELHGLRITTMAMFSKEEDDRDMCGAMCFLQKSFLSLLDSVAKNESMRNMSVATVLKLRDSFVSVPPLPSLSSDSPAARGGRGSKKAGASKASKQSRRRRWGTKEERVQLEQAAVLRLRWQLIQKYLQRGSSTGSRDGEGKEWDKDKERKEESGRGLSQGARAIVHSFLSPLPQQEYHCHVNDSSEE